MAAQSRRPIDAEAKAQGKGLLVTPGVYYLDQTINITRANIEKP
jgi:hypothetical protein